MDFEVTVEVIDKMRFRISADSREERAPGCKVTTWGSKWPKDDKCAPEISCPRCIAIRAIEEHIIPEQDGMEVKFDKIKPIVTLSWAIGGDDAQKDK